MTALRLPLVLLACWLTTAAAGADEPPALDRHGDPLPPGSVARLGTVRLRHSNTVGPVAWAPNGKLVAAGGHESFIHLWNPESGKEVARLPSLTRYVYCLAFSPDGRWLASAGDDPAVNLWDVATLGKQAKPRQLPGHPQHIAGLVFAPDGKTLYSSGGDGLVRAWDVNSGRELRQFGPGKGRVRHLALDRAGRQLVGLHTTADNPNKQIATAHLWNALTGEHLRQLGKPERELYDVAFAPDGLTVVASGDRGAKLWEVASGAEIGKLRGSANYAPSVAFAPDGASVWVGGSGFFQQMAVPSGRLLRSLEVDHSYVYSIAFAPDGKTIATGNTRTVALWDAATGKPRHAFPGHQADVNAVLFTAGGREVLTAGYGRPVYRWDLQGRLLGEWRGPQDWNSNCVLSPDGKTLAIQGKNMAIMLLDPRTGKERLRFTNHLPPRTSAHTQMEFAFTADSRRVVSVAHGIDNYVRTWEADTGKEIGKIQIGEPYKRTITGLALAPDGKTVYVASQQGPVKVLDASSGKQRGTLGKESDYFRHLALSRDGRRLAAAARDAVIVWEVAGGTELHRLPALPGYLPRLVFSPGGHMLAGWNNEAPLRLWELASGQLRLEVTGHSGRIHEVSFSPDGRLFLTGSADTTALLWDLWALPLAGKAVAGPNLDGLWDAIAAQDAGVAHRAVVRLQQLGAKGLAALAVRLAPVKLPPWEKLVADLDDSKFQVRERATVALAAIAENLQRELTKALAGSKSDEARRRLQRILDGVKLGSAAQVRARLRSLRALEVLEGIGSVEARRVLEGLARGTPGTELTLEASAALKRLQARGR